MGSHAVILLFLLLYIPAVILSEAKDPEDLSLRPLSGPFHPKISTLRFFLKPTPATVISTEAARAFCERRSGEIRFSTSTLVCFSFALQLFFPIFRPKIACQVPKLPNQFTINNIRVAF
jgi:hypothetical protein